MKKTLESDWSDQSGTYFSIDWTVKKRFIYSLFDSTRHLGALL